MGVAVILLAAMVVLQTYRISVLDNKLNKLMRDNEKLARVCGNLLDLDRYIVNKMVMPLTNTVDALVQALRSSEDFED